MNQRLIIILLLLLPATMFGQKQKFQINGAARAYYFANELDIDEELDSITARKSNYGQTLLDLGVSVFPNNNTEVLGMFRIRNDLGGFWGGGVTFNVRQLTLKGVAGGVVRYELGDIDINMTPYTLWNYREEGVVNEGDIFALRRDVIHYDMFYTDDNTWRMQGGNAGFGLTFGRVIKEMNFYGFLTRLQATDGFSIPERLFGGGRYEIVQSDNFKIGFNTVNVFDLTETIQDSIQFKNSVHTGDIDFGYSVNDNTRIGLVAEGGISESSYENYDDPGAPESVNDWFYDAALVAELKPQGVKIALGYKDVGADFLAPGAQTRRVDFSRFPGLYQQYTNDAVGRPASSIDVVSGSTENSFRLSDRLMSYRADLNNTTPYGNATPNRTGIYLNIERTDTVLFRHTFARVSMLSQSRGTGTLEAKQFMLVEAGTDVYLNDIYDGENDLKIDLGVRYESTTRGGEEFEASDLQSTFIDVGFAWEFFNDLDLLAGAKMWMVQGKAFVNERDAFNAIQDFDIVDYDYSENTYALGLRYCYNEKNTLSVHYQAFEIDHADEDLVDYGISQFSFLYNLRF